VQDRDPVGKTPGVEPDVDLARPGVEAASEQVAACSERVEVVRLAPGRVDEDQLADPAGGQDGSQRSAEPLRGDDGDPHARQPAAHLGCGQAQ
jgi:hypothetical protein